MDYISSPASYANQLLLAFGGEKETAIVSLLETYKNNKFPGVSASWVSAVIRAIHGIENADQ